ncbi:cupin-like domain-containing protein [Methylocystis iwaonis]|uniref:cupin-like domain-containing protein n=1 Tax=Methylocystis iwaonis TaxID=2885079 RepID=UPI002E7C43D1|nr:cupin-like domain-containing protein [Methylocystis iwaonis]
MSITTETTQSHSHIAAQDEIDGHGVDTVPHLTSVEFAERYVAKNRPVLIKRALADSVAFKSWTFDRLRQQSGSNTVLLKDWRPGGKILTRQSKIAAYLDEIEQYEVRRAAGDDRARRPAYLHDMPLTSVFPDAAAGLAAFPQNFFPSWYGASWTDFAQFFLGPSWSYTPLHFDCLLTHNLFFQLRGRKCFTVLDYDQRNYCYVHDWRWSAVNPESPDFDMHPLFRHARPQQVIVEPGDVFFMPSGMLHHVRSLDAAMSLNVDWHTKSSAARGVLALTQGMPLKNVYYNALIAFGLWTGAGRDRIFPYYRSYLNYVS